MALPRQIATFPREGQQLARFDDYSNLIKF